MHDYSIVFDLSVRFHLLTSTPQRLTHLHDQAVLCFNLYSPQYIYLLSVIYFVIQSDSDFIQVTYDVVFQVSSLNRRLLQCDRCVYVHSFIDRSDRGEEKVCSGDGFARCLLLTSRRRRSVS